MTPQNSPLAVNLSVYILSVVLSFCLGLGCRQASAQAPAPAWVQPKPQSVNSLPRVLLLYSNDRFLPANLRFDSGFREVLDQGFDERYELFTEFLDAVRFPGEERSDAMAVSLRVRYKERPPHVLVAGGPEALDFFLNRRDWLFPHTPLVFGGLRLRDRPEIKFGPDVVGVPMSSEIVPTLEMVLRVRPRTREVVVVSGSAKSDREWNAVARTDFRPFESRIKVTFWDALPFTELTKRAHALPPEAAMFYLAYFQEPDGTLMPSSARALEILAANCSAPVFGIYDTLLGKGLVGGQMTDFAGEGAAVGRLVERILDGEAPPNIGLQTPRQAVFYFDAKQLDRWGIPESALPAGSQVLFRQPSLWQTHRNAVLLALTVILAQTTLIFLLISARRRTREVDANLTLAAEAANVGLWHRNAATDQIKASPKWRALFGLPLKGRITIDDVMRRLPAEDEVKVRKAIDGAAANGQSYSMEHRVVFPDGGTRWIASHGRADTGSNGQLLGTRGASMDVTERRRTAMELDEQRQELAHLSRVASLGVLSGALAHELNQPLGIILSNAQAAQHLLSNQHPDLDELKAILEDIVSEDRRAGDVIKRLRVLLRRGESTLEPIDVNENIKEVLRLTRSDFIRRGVAVVCQFSDDLPAATSDRVQLQQVLLNLITNACDAMETNLPMDRLVTLSTFFKENEICLAVQDRGVGLPEDVETMFKPFHTTKAHGLGMGLAICRSLVAAHGGRLWAEPNPDRGATFYVALTIANEGP
jgi:signal transduction histidine kinase